MARLGRRRGAQALSAPLLLCGLWGCLRSQPGSSGPVPIQLPPLSLVSTPQPFPPQGLVYAFDGDLVVTHADRPLLSTLTSDELALAGPDRTVAGAPDPWTAPVLSVGRGGAAFLLASDGSFYALDLDKIGSKPLGRIPAAATLTAFSARRDADGVLWADGAGAIHRVGDSGAEDLVIPSRAGETVAALTSALDGRVLWVAEANGACAGVRSFTTSNVAAVDLELGAPPCQILLGHDSQTLWVAGRTASGTRVTALKASSLTTRAPPSSVDGIAATRIVVGSDDRNLALLGAGPKASVAEARTAHVLGTEPPPDNGVWRLLSNALVKEATDGLFDEQGALYLANPADSRVEIVR